MKFIVCAPRYEETSGGSIVLHKLAAILNSLGHEALLWPLHRVWLRPRPFSNHWWHRYTYAATRIYRPLYGTKPGTILKLAKESDIDSAVVIYPETVSGNPLYARRYVHWLLYGRHTDLDNANFERSELYFCYQEAFNYQREGSCYGGILCVRDFMLDIYKNTNSGTRSGTCYMIRKGKTRKDLPSFRGKFVIDGLDHNKLANIFNEMEYCYFYDLYTVYSTYAAVCGCIPVVVPLRDLPKEEWEPNGGRKPGIAYGKDEIPYAIESRHILMDRICNAERDNTKSVKRFVNVVHAHFR